MIGLKLICHSDVSYNRKEYTVESRYVKIGLLEILVKSKKTFTLFSWFTNFVKCMSSFCY